MDQFDSGKHSGIIAFINLHYVKTGIFDKSFSKMVDSAFRLREKADYEDFYVVAIEDAEKQIGKAESVIAAVEQYIKTRWEEQKLFAENERAARGPRSSPHDFVIFCSLLSGNLFVFML